MQVMESEKRNQLIEDGYCILENILDVSSLAELNKTSLWTIDKMLADEPEHFDRKRSQGCVIPYSKYPHPVFTNLIVDPRALKALALLGFDNPKVWTGFVISKPPYSPPLYWHQDGVLWSHPISYTDQPQQYFLMYYLVDTNRNNGCLRVIPGSHRNRHVLHDIEKKDLYGEVSRGTDLDHPAMQHAEGEIDVPVTAGDLVIGDSRLLHSAHANQSSQRRTVLIIWYWPDYDKLPDEVKALVTEHFAETNEKSFRVWADQTKAVTGGLIPSYSGSAKPPSWNNFPNASLK